MAAAGCALSSCAVASVRAECAQPRATLAKVSSSFLAPARWGRSFTQQAACPTRSRFISVLTRRGEGERRTCLTVAIDPDFYKIPHVQGIPQGSKLMLFNLPSTDDRESLKRDLLEWFTSLEEPVNVTNFEFTDDPQWNERGVGAFIEFATKWEAVTAYARLDASKFQGRYVRMDFVERKPFPPEWLAKNARWFRDDSNLPNAKIFVGNLAWSVDDAKLQNLFAAHGTVYDAKVLTDRETGRSRGFGFVTMSTEEEMNKAIQAVNGTQLDGRSLRVNQAAAKPQ